MRRRGVVCTVYDPCCGSGGMLMITKEHITVGLRKNGDVLRPPINKDAEIHLFGQEVNPETWAVSKSDLFMKDPTGRDADNIAFGSTLSNDRHAGKTFDYLIANPPYGKDWKRDQEIVEAENARGAGGRFGPGLPRISDGQLLFLLHMLAHAKAPDEGGSRIAIIMNGSPLFTGDSGSGESEIRRFVLENDLLEALIALPEQLFYNTGIATYVWVLSTRKAAARKRKVQLIDASAFWVPMRKSLGDKRREIPLERAQDILKILADFGMGIRAQSQKTESRRTSSSAAFFRRRISGSGRSPSSGRCGSTSRRVRTASRVWRTKRVSGRSRNPRRRAPQEPRNRPRDACCRRQFAICCTHCRVDFVTDRAVFERHAWMKRLGAPG